MSVPDSCPHCHAERGPFPDHDDRWKCGTWAKSGASRMPECYKRQIAALREQLAAIQNDGSTGLERALDSLACKEVARLQDIINAAPHSDDCYSNHVSPLTGFSLPCNCWKEKALEP